jgi:hypothetical protein
MNDICVLPHHFEPDRQRRAIDGLYVCAGCLGKLEQSLAELPAQYDALAVALAPRNGRTEQVTGTPERALPIDPAVADHREHIGRVLVSWSMLVAEERGINPPGGNAPSMTAPWLLVHLRWACAQPWIDDYADELTGLRRRAHSLLYPTGRRRVDIGDCVEPDCGGTLTATITRQDDLLPSSVDCDVNPEHSWSPSDWHALGRRLHGAAGFERRTAAQFMDLVRSA